MNKIRWKQQDYISLGKAVASFNKKLNEIRTDFNEEYLPQEKSYQKLKETIKTRNDLKKTINSLKRFKKEGAEEVYQTEAGELMTKWERRELGIQSRSAQVRLKAELKQIEQQKPSKYMGDDRADEIKSSIKKLKSIEKRTNKKLQELKDYIKKMSSSSHALTKAENYRNYYMRKLERLSNSRPEFKRVYEELNKIKDPEEFYRTIKRSDLAKDIEEWYKNPADYGGFNSSEELADYLFKDLFGIVTYEEI